MTGSSRSRVKRLVAPAGIALVIVGAIVAMRSRAVPVSSAEVHRGALAVEVMGTGTLEARVSAMLGPRVAGLLTDVLVDEGDRVRRGQLLATLYDGDLQQQVRVAEADRRFAEASIDQSTAQTLAAAANATEAQSSYHRVAELVDSRAVSRDDFDKALQKRDVAEAELKRARTNEIAASRQLARANEAERYARERLADTRIVAPFDGLVVKRSRDAGNVAVPGDAVVQVISLDTLWIAAWVDETALAAVQVGRPARIVFRSEPSSSYEGTVARIEPRVDPETREFLVDVAVRKLPERWALGQRAEVYISSARKDETLTVPSAAVQQRDGRSGVFVSSSGRLRWRPVKLGLNARDHVEVLSGLAEGDVVAWPAGAASPALSDGLRVKAR